MMFFHVLLFNPNCNSQANRDSIKALVKKVLLRYGKIPADFKITKFEEKFLIDNVESVAISDASNSLCEVIELTDTCEIVVHVFQLHQEGPADEILGDDEDVIAAHHWILPAAQLHNVWNNLIYEDNVKSKLLNYISTTLLFSDKKINQEIITWNRIVLLHGPPGTGKTSLCKALAHKLSIRFSYRYSYGQLIEINSHSLFSKWFSESGKLVLKMFQKIQELINDPKALVCILIDEVESLTSARTAAVSGSEPSDAIRVVNALLTQLDRIKSYPNVIILTTSNITNAIDSAFVDRADIKQYIGPPSVNAILEIYRSGLNELMRAGVIAPAELLLNHRTLETMNCADQKATRLSLKLLDIARDSIGLSGRHLRKLPFLAHALIIQLDVCTLEDFIIAMAKAVKQCREELKHFQQ